MSLSVAATAMWWFKRPFVCSQIPSTNIVHCVQTAHALALTQRSQTVTALWLASSLLFAMGEMLVKHRTAWPLGQSGGAVVSRPGAEGRAREREKNKELRRHETPHVFFNCWQSFLFPAAGGDVQLRALTFGLWAEFDPHIGLKQWVRHRVVVTFSQSSLSVLFLPGLEFLSYSKLNICLSLAKVKKDPFRLLRYKTIAMLAAMGGVHIGKD